MASDSLEIERKFLLKDDSWKMLSEKSIPIEQYYFIDDNGVTCRVRKIGNDFLMTMKIKQTDVTSEEYEFSIPEAVYHEFKKRSSGGIEKVRHYISHNGKTWEVDVFGGKNKGLVLAEIELQSEDEGIVLPEFIGVEVTDNMEYRNVNLSK